MQFPDYFDQIYVINLPERHDRRREMTEQLKTIGLSFDSPGIQLFEAVRPDDAKGFPSIGARGCYLSHLAILRDARERQFDRILIFEDDLNFPPDFTARIDEVVAGLEREDWSMFYGGYAMASLPQSNRNEIVVPAAPSDSIQTTHFVGFRGQAIGELTLYLEKLLTRPPGDPKGGPMHVDGAYNWFRRDFPSNVTLLSVAQLGYQRSSRTDIHSLRWVDRVSGTRQAMGWIRAIRNWANH